MSCCPGVGSGGSLIGGHGWSVTGVFCVISNNTWCKVGIFGDGFVPMLMRLSCVCVLLRVSVVTIPVFVQIYYLSCPLSIFHPSHSDSPFIFPPLCVHPLCLHTFLLVIPLPSPPHPPPHPPHTSPPTHTHNPPQHTYRCPSNGEYHSHTYNWQC